MGEEHRGKFSEGEEELPDSPAKEHVGRFSEGEEEEPDSPEKERPGSFGDHDEYSVTAGSARGRAPTRLRKR